MEWVAELLDSPFSRNGLVRCPPPPRAASAMSPLHAPRPERSPAATCARLALGAQVITSREALSLPFWLRDARETRFPFRRRGPKAAQATAKALAAS